MSISAHLEIDGFSDNAFIESAKAKFIDTVGNDLNTALGITCIYDVLKADTTDATKLAILKSFDEVLSINLVREKTEEAPKEKTEFELQIEALIEERKQAKKDKNFARADEIRAQLASMGVTIKDTREGTTYTIG